MAQFWFRVSLILIDAETTEISACQKMRMDGQTGRRLLYIVDTKWKYVIYTVNYSDWQYDIINLMDVEHFK